MANGITDVDDMEDDDISEQDEDDENDLEEVKALKVSRFFAHQRCLSKRANATISTSLPHRCLRARALKKTIDSRVP